MLYQKERLWKRATKPNQAGKYLRKSSLNPVDLEFRKKKISYHRDFLSQRSYIFPSQTFCSFILSHSRYPGFHTRLFPAWRCCLGLSQGPSAHRRGSLPPCNDFSPPKSPPGLDRSPVHFLFLALVHQGLPYGPWCPLSNLPPASGMLALHRCCHSCQELWIFLASMIFLP